MEINKIRKQIENTSKKVSNSKNLYDQNRHLRDFIIWLIGYIDGIEKNNINLKDYEIVFGDNETKREDFVGRQNPGNPGINK